jgi:hypothetical protein
MALEVTLEKFQSDVLEKSLTVPVLVDFWAEVERVLPEYKEGRKFLKDHGSSILVRFD